MNCLSATKEITFYEHSWEADDPKAIVLLVHGLGEHCRRWDHVGEWFSKRGYSVRSYDLRGHGRTSGSRLDVHDFDEHLQDLRVQIEKARRVGLPLYVYAHSMGGLIATRYARTTAPQPDAYVLSAPALGAKVPGILRVAAKILGTLIPCFRMNAAITGEQLSCRPEVGEAYFADEHVNLKGTARHGKLLLAAMTETCSDLSHLHIPTLVVHGGDDTLVPPEASEILADCEGVERKVFPGLRHEMHNEDEWEDVLGYVEKWLSQ